MNADDEGAASRCFSPDDPEPVIVHNSGAAAPLLLICDHAGRLIPQPLRSLGLDPAALDRHIAWDIGAAGLARRLADGVGAELLMQAYSRLVVDCNRAPESPDIAPAVSDGTPIPANAGLTAGALADRIARVHSPYHAAIASALDRRVRTLLVSVHSFTPAMNGLERPWHVGVLHSHDSPASRRMLQALRGCEGLVVGDNQPYAMDGIDYTIPRHAKARGLDYLELEVRQDLIAEAAGQTRMADLLAPMIVRSAQTG
ncbi:MAG TPA: N-formylglutamate amidohydrolase [Caulobacteraceae bacterium]